MSIRAKLLATVSALVVMGALGVAKADDKTQPAGEQGLKSVDKNITKDSAKGKSNDGLTNAKTRIEDNMAERKAKDAKVDGDDKKKKQHDADDKTHKDKVERAAKADRPERAGR